MHSRKKSGKGGRSCLSPPKKKQQQHTCTLFTVDMATLGCRMAPSRSQILTVPRWFSLPSGSQIIACNYRFCNSSLFWFLHWLLSEQPWNSLRFVRVFPMEYSTSVKEASTKVIVTKTVIIINHLATTVPGRRVDHCGIATSILQLSSSKNEGGRVRLCQNSVALRYLLQLHQSNVR